MFDDIDRAIDNDAAASSPLTSIDLSNQIAVGMASQSVR
jgi:hypothetical protein